MGSHSLVLELPLVMDGEGRIRVGLTRVTFDEVVEAFERGLTPEEIVFAYPDLDLLDVYVVCVLCLHEPEAVQQYLSQRQGGERRQFDEERRQREVLRERLLVREQRAGRVRFRERLETEVLGLLLLDPASLTFAAERLRETDFSSKRHRLVFEAMQKLYDDGSEINLRTISEALGEKLDAAGGFAFIAGLDLDLKDPRMFESYVLALAAQARKTSQPSAPGNRRSEIQES